MGMLAYVYRNAHCDYDCTNGGWSSRYSQVCVTNVSGPFEPNEKTPAVRLYKDPRTKVVYVISEEHRDSGAWVMFGGNYLSCSDSRFSEAMERLTGIRYHGAPKIHDRVE